MTITVKQYTGQHDDDWDALLSRCPSATFLHSRRFLSYHGDKFHDVSLLLHDEKGKLCGVFPAAVNLNNEHEIASHPGATYGGVVATRALQGHQMLLALKNVAAFYQQAGYHRLLYKAVPYCFQQTPLQDDLYAMFRLGFEQVRVDLSSVIDLSRPLKISATRKWSRNKARKSGVKIFTVPDENFPKIGIADVWETIRYNLASTHNTTPTHSLEQLQQLITLFPNNIIVRAGVIDGEIVCAGVFFIDNRFCHAQYLSVNERGRQTRANDALVGDAIEHASQNRYDWFSFGISTENDGKYINESLYDFKRGFGGSGAVHGTYALDLTKFSPQELAL